MRLLLVGDLDQPHLRRWAEALAASDFEVTAAGFGEASLAGVDTISFGGVSAARRAGWISAGTQLASVARQVRPHLVHAHFVSSYGVLASAVVRRRCPVVLFAWGSDILWHDRRPAPQRHAVLRTLRASSLVVYDSADVGERLNELAPGVPTELAMFGPEDEWTRAPRDEQRRVLSPRQLKPFYNVLTIVEAFAVALAPNDWHLDVLSSGAPSDDVDRLIEEHRLASAATVWPRLDRSAMRKRYLCSAMTCSVPDSDATSAAVLEAMATGSLPIVSDLPANRMLIRDGENGLVVRAGSVRDLAGAMERAAADEGFRRAAAQRNRSWVAEYATWEAAVHLVVSRSADLASSQMR